MQPGDYRVDEMYETAQAGDPDKIVGPICEKCGDRKGDGCPCVEDEDT